MSNELFHYGTPHQGAIPHSGRYKYGSGENPNQHGSESITSQSNRLRAQGYSEVETARELGLSTGQLRDAISNEKNAEKAAKQQRVFRMKEHGYSAARIAEETGIPERTVRNWLDGKGTQNVTKSENVANTLKEIVDEKGYVDVGSGVEYLLDTKSGTISKALNILQEEGYSVYTIKAKNVTDPSKFTNIKVLCKPDTTWAEVQNNQDLIQSITEYSNDGGESFMKVQYPSSISSDRVMIRYAEDGGKDFDGVMYIRRGCDDLSLGNSNYAQVRIAVDGTHYLKGMALYSDDLPDGCDILFNTNKTKDVPKMKVLKPLKDSEDMPFGAVIKANGQSYYEDENGKYVKEGSNYVLADKKTSKDAPRYSLSAINKLKEEGDWNEYSKTLSSQMLSKQSYSLIKRQLDLSLADKMSQFDDIKKVRQPEIRKKLLEEFASDCDSSAVDLKAMALPGQTNKVILPLTCIRDDQVYAPGYANGTQLALIRYPHAGLFEIPIVTVNNNNREAKRILGNTPLDAIGITSKVAQKLSGADFDGDTVVAIPLSDRVKIQSQSTLKGLKDFDPSSAFPGYPGMKVMTSKQKGLEMGMISNLITDMTLQGATPSELERAVKHSMVVIDAQKHELNWKLSEEVNGIAALKKEYQSKPNGRYGGASTLISKASSEEQVPERKQVNLNKHVDRDTGKLIFEETERKFYKATVKNEETGKSEKVNTYLDKKTNEYFYYNTDSFGKKQRVYVDSSKVKEQLATQKSTKMAETDDAFKLSSGTKKESAYAEYANALKDLGNKARLEYVNTKGSKVDPSAKATYSKEIESLNAKYELAALNSPKERRAQVVAGTKVKNLLIANPSMTEEEEKKARQQALSSARSEVGANKKNVQIHPSDTEWEAILNGAFTGSKVLDILKNMDSEEIKRRATPKDTTTLSTAKISLIRQKASAGFTIDEIAQSLGVSSSTVSKYIKE